MSSQFDGATLPSLQTEPILQLRQIGKSFSGVPVLCNISLDLFPGQVHCLVGENGAGKSTLIKIISGAYARDEGTITYQGQVLHHVTPQWARLNGINTIYQEIDLIPSLDAAENIFLGNEPLTPAGNIDWAAVHREADRILADIEAEIDTSVPVGQLKIAQQELVAVAKALSLKSKVIILDEPTAAFTGSEVTHLFKTIRRLKAQGIGIIYISHHLDEIFEIGDHVTVLRDGNLIRSDPIGAITKNALVKAMVGREIDLARRNGVHERGGEVIRAEGLTQKGVVHDASFSVHRGEIVGVAGLVGAGRSDLARMLIGAAPVHSGRILLHGKPQRIGSPKHALDLGIGMLPEDRKAEGLVLIRPVSENIGYSLAQASSRVGMVPWKRIGSRIQELIQEVNLRPPDPNRQVFTFSGGNQQKVVLARWLAAKCDLLILDEPTRGVDVGARAEIYGLMQKLKHEGKGILMISSDMTEILTQSDRILVMAEGRIVGELDGKTATQEQVLSLALELTEAVA